MDAFLLHLLFTAAVSKTPYQRTGLTAQESTDSFICGRVDPNLLWRSSMTGCKMNRIRPWYSKWMSGRVLDQRGPKSEKKKVK